MKKKMLALFVCAALVLTLLPAAALADDVKNYVMDFSQSVGVSWMGGGFSFDFSQNDYTAVFYNTAGTSSKWQWAYETKTLTLQNITFTTTASIGIKLPAGSTLVLEGTNSVTANGGGATLNAAICVDEATAGDLTIKGEGSLTATGGGATSGTSCGIYVPGTLTVESGTLNATGGTVTDSINEKGAYSYGVKCSSITINGGTVTANGGKGIVTSGVEGGLAVSYGVECEGCVSVNGGTLTATGEDSGIDTNIFELRGGSVVATGEDTDSNGIYVYVGSTNDGHNTTWLPGKVSVFAGTLTAEGGASGIRAFDMGDGAGGIIATSSVTVSGGSVKCTGSKYGICSDSGVTVTGGMLYATGNDLAVSLFAAKPTNVTATGSNTYKDPISNLGAVNWDGTNRNYIINGTGNTPLPQTLYLASATDDGHYPPTIVAPTKDTEVELEAGASGALSISATGATAYQWQMRLPGGNWQDIPRATDPTLAVSGDVGDGTEYRCFASNSYGSVVSRTVTVRTVTVPQTGDRHTAAGYVMIALLALVTAAVIYRKKRA